MVAQVVGPSVSLLRAHCGQSGVEGVEPKFTQCIIVVRVSQVFTTLGNSCTQHCLATIKLWLTSKEALIHSYDT